MHFNNVHTNFFEILQQLYPELTEKDLKQCAYIKMGLSVKEVASLMNISIRAVEKARMKIKAKMNLGTEVNLSVHLQRISP
jgi:AraC family chitin signaling transcriptional activator